MPYPMEFIKNVLDQLIDGLKTKQLCTLNRSPYIAVHVYDPYMSLQAHLQSFVFLGRRPYGFQFNEMPHIAAQAQTALGQALGNGSSFTSTTVAYHLHFTDADYTIAIAVVAENQEEAFKIWKEFKDLLEVINLQPIFTAPMPE